MAQWINVLRNNSFVNPTQLPLLCGNSGAVALAERGPTEGQSGVANPYMRPEKCKGSGDSRARKFVATALPKTGASNQNTSFVFIKNL